MPRICVLFLVMLLLLAPAFGQPPRRPVPKPTATQRPVNNPRPGRSYPQYAHGLFVFGGEVKAQNLNGFTVAGMDAQGKARTMRFRLAEGGKFPEDVKLGSRVAVQYTTTLESALYEVVRCRKLPDGEDFPTPSFPENK
ncbi:MAG: hypothetical protein HY319_29385 [Armatimonadetes bacterium]|nr:hypothetical protein [Armatimonadota bacterium]